MKFKTLYYYYFLHVLIIYTHKNYILKFETIFQIFLDLQTF